MRIKIVIAVITLMVWFGFINILLPWLSKQSAWVAEGCMVGGTLVLIFGTFEIIKQLFKVNKQ